MASAHKDAKGWRICYIDPNGNRRSLRPGKVNKTTANQIAHYVELLVAATASRGTLERTAAAWLGEISDTLHAKLARAGLTTPREKVAPVPEPSMLLLKDFLQDRMTHGRTAQGNKAAPATVVKWRPTQVFLNKLFPGRELASITAEDAHQFRVWLDSRRIKQKTAGRRGQPMTENAKRRHIATCKMFFNAAKRRGLVSVNPFESQVSGTQANRSRDFYVTPGDMRKILDAAPDVQWRLMIALWRLAGLRKMEVFRLTWGDVQWQAGKLRVTSSKTAHHDGCDVRFVPLRDVLPYLKDALQDALPAGKRSLPVDAAIITRFSASNSNLDKPFRVIVESAGLVPWPKLFQNLRASCETQWLKDGERADLVANWMGHSVTVQRRHYVQHTDEDIAAFNARPSFKSGNTGGNKGTRNETNRRERVIVTTRSKPGNNTGPQRFSASNVIESINPART